MSPKITEAGQPASSGGKKRALGAILAAIMVCRLAFAVLAYARPELARANDTDRYIPIAKGLLAGTAYKWDRERPGELLSTIGYPLFLAGVFATVGDEPGDVALAQLLLTGVVALLLYAVFARWLGTAAFLPALLLLVDPLTILYAMTILTETLLAALLSLALMCLGLWVFERRGFALVLAGLFTGLACLVKPMALLILAVWAVAIIIPAPPLVQRAGSRSISRTLAVSAFLLAPVILIAPWYVRNSLLWDCPGLSSVDRVTLRDYVAGKMLVETDHITIEEAQRQLQASDPGNCPRQTNRYWNMVMANPATYGRLHLGGTIAVLVSTNFDRWLQYFGVSYTLPDLWRPYMDDGWKGLLNVLLSELRSFPQELSLMLFMTVFQASMYLLAALGMYAVVHRGSNPARWYAADLALAILILVLTPGQGGHERFRVPMQPFFGILAGYWVARRSLLVSPGKIRHDEVPDI